MTVSQRLYLTVVPAILGVFAVAALAYWGQYGKTAPQLLVIVGAIASVGSLIVAWRNTRYVATRVTRLAAPAQVTRPDALDTIEEEVARLRRSVVDADMSRAEAEALAGRRVREYADLVGESAAAVARHVDDIRMPLHILLESHFGDLNENQEEMLAAARTAADDVHSRLDQLRAIADVDRGAPRLHLERIRLTDLVEKLLPSVAATAARDGVTVAAELSPLQGAAVADRTWLSEALSLLFLDAVRRTPAGATVRIVSADHDPREPPRVVSVAGAGPDALAAQLVVLHGAGASRSVDVALADRLIALQRGRVAHEPRRTLITLPGDPLPEGMRAGASRPRE